jgi:AcrR family transcriptional regulator
MVAVDDLTARARIRQAALAQFAEHGFERATIRDIAAAAGVSLGLVRHHFGSKKELRDAIDAYILEELRRMSDEVFDAMQRGDARGITAVTRSAMRPFQGYLARALAEGSTTLATLFDALVAQSEQFLALDPDDTHFVDGRVRAAVSVAMSLGVPLMREQLSRVLGVDTFSPEGDQLVALALLDIYAHPMTTLEFAENARDALLATPPEPRGEER